MAEKIVPKHEEAKFLTPGQLRILRKRLDMSMAELAQRSKLSEAMLSLFETQKRGLSKDAQSRVLTGLILKLDEWAAAEAVQQAHLREELSRREKEKSELIALSIQFGAAIRQLSEPNIFAQHGSDEAATK